MKRRKVEQIKPEVVNRSTVIVFEVFYVGANQCQSAYNAICMRVCIFRPVFRGMGRHKKLRK